MMRRAAPNAQQGFSIVSLMVAAALAMMITIAMLSLYVSTTKITKVSKAGATQDGQIASGFLVGQLNLQGAGYGLTTAALNTDLVLVQGATLDSATKKLSGTAANIITTAVTGNAVIWGSNTSGSYQCAGLFTPSTGGLLLLTPASCTNASSAWNTVTWTTTSVIGSVAVTMTATKTAAAGCQPFGIVDPNGVKGGAIVALSASNSSASSSTTSSTCLANFAAS